MRDTMSVSIMDRSRIRAIDWYQNWLPWLNDLERRNGRYFALLNVLAFRATTSKRNRATQAYLNTI